MKTVTHYDNGDAVMVKSKRRGAAAILLIIDGKWAKGEGHGYWAVPPGGKPEDGQDVPARRILGLARGYRGHKGAPAKGRQRRAS